MSHLQSPFRILPRVLLLVLALVATTSSVRAQVVPDEPDLDDFRVTVGPFRVRPSVSLTNLGVDTNVFNEADIDQPKSDFTIGVTPRADFWLPAGRTWLRGSVREDLVWYEKYANESAANGFYSAGWLAPFNRFSTYIAGDFVEARERPGFEIDARVDRRERAVSAAAELRVLSRTFPGISFQRRTIEFDEAQGFLGTPLTDLNRTNTVAGFTLEHELTPLTTLLFDVSSETDRFELVPDRDTDSTRVRGGFQFDPFALIAGSAHLGYRDFRPAAPDVPGYAGVIADVDVSYVARESTRLGLQVSRDIAYSFDAAFPYYVQTGVAASIAQRIYGDVDARAQVASYRLSYRQREGAVLQAPDRADRVTRYGAGIGYRLGSELRVGFDVDREQRTSVLDFRTYSRLRYGLSVAYGL